MKAGNFIAYALIFCAAWVSLAVIGWGPAQAFSMEHVMPWVQPIFTAWPSTVALSIGAVIAILGSFLSALVLLAVLFAIEAIWRRLRRSVPEIPS